MSADLALLQNLLQHEANELEARGKSPELDANWQRIFSHQARGVLLALSMVEDLLSGHRPGAGCRSAGAHHFHKYGESLPVGSAECFPSVAPEVRFEDGTRRRFYAVHQFESDEVGTVHFRRISAPPMVGNNDRSLHGSFLSQSIDASGIRNLPDGNAHPTQRGRVK